MLVFEKMTIFSKTSKVQPQSVAVKKKLPFLMCMYLSGIKICAVEMGSATLGNYLNSFKKTNLHVILPL